MAIKPGGPMSHADDDKDIIPVSELDIVDPVADLDVPIHDANGRPYWRSPFFLGTYTAVIFGAMGYYTGFAMPANTLSVINADIGPSASITWVANSFTLSSAVATVLVGRLSDIFGRRYFFITGSIIALIGTIVSSQAKTVDILIGATVLTGLGSGIQGAYPYVIAEMVPYKHRNFMIGFMNIFVLPCSAFAPMIARSFVANYAAGWRGSYYLAVAINVVGTLLWICFYFPPEFSTLHRSRSRWEQIRRIDYVGLVLFCAGLLLFLMGISWGGQLYPWKSGHVIGTMIAGALSLVAFVLYEIFSHVGDEGFIPMSIFASKQFDVICSLAVVVIYPTLVQALYTTEDFRIGVLSCGPAAGTAFGLWVGGLVSERLGRIKLQYVASACCVCAFTGAIASANPGNEKTITALTVLSGFWVGYLNLLTEGGSTIALKDQHLLGSAIGVFAAMRTVGGTVATTVYVTILNNSLASGIANKVAPAVVAAGLPSDEVTGFLAVFNSGNATAITVFPNVTKAIIQAATTATTSSYIDAFQKIFLTSIAFSGCAIIASLFYKDYDAETMRRGVVVTLELPKHQHEHAIGD